MPENHAEPQLSAPRVVHCKRERYDVYIGRPSKWGNPFVIAKGDGPASDGQTVVLTREEAVARYREYIESKPFLMAEAQRELRGKILGCWCAPKACHGDILLRIANA